MKMLIASLILIMTAAVSAHADDMQKYLTDTQMLAKEGKHKEALDRFVWFHNHALEHSPSMYGVRLSFALMYWKQLGEVYPPALAEMKKIRDEKTAVIEGGKGTFNLFHDVAALNKTLGEDGKTVALFRKLDKDQEAFATACWEIAKEAIITEKAYDLARKYIGNPLREFGKVKEAYDRNKTMYGRENFGEHFKAFNENHFVKETLRLIELAVALDDAETAKAIREKALSVVDDYRLRDAIPKRTK